MMINASDYSLNSTKVPYNENKKSSVDSRKSSLININQDFTKLIKSMHKIYQYKRIKKGVEFDKMSK